MCKQKHSLFLCFTSHLPFYDMRISYNSPVILTFTVICVALQALPQFLTNEFFTVAGHMNPFNPIDYFRLFSHAMGHANWSHLLGNFMLILLIGPLIEEKYGSRDLFFMMLITATVTGLLNVILFSSGLRGASGIVFMLILLGSVTNLRDGNIPLTFILVVLLYLGSEILNALKPDHVSQFAHILGGIGGAAFGFLIRPQKSKAKA